MAVLAGAVWMRSPRVADALDAGELPAVPDLSARPAILADSIAEAMALAHVSSSRLAGVIELGRLYHANQLSREAETCWELLRRAQPEEPRWCYYLADLRRTAGDQDGMIALLKETLRLAPDYAPARLQLANVELKTGKLVEAEANFRLRLDALPRDPYARLGLARVAMQQGRDREARGLLEALLQDTPHFSTAHNLYAGILAAAGDEAEAARHRWLGQETLRFREAEDPWLDELDTWCHDYDRLCARGTLEFLSERHDAARDLFTRAIRLRPDVPQAYELLADLHLQRHKPDEARDLLEAAQPKLNIQPSHHFFTTLSQANRELKQPAEAIRVAREGLAQAENTPELHDALGLALAEAGQHEEAVHAWQAGLAQRPGDASMNYNQALSLLELRRLDEALTALDRSLTLQPTFLPTLLLRGEIEIQAGHLELAEKFLRPAIESHPEHPQARRLMAAWHLGMGGAASAANDAPAAERHYRAGLDLVPDHPGLLLHLGVTCLLNRRFKQAVDPLTAYHTLQPDDPQGCLFLGQAYAGSRQVDKAREILHRGARLAEEAGKGATAARCRRILEQL
ncbi:MAG: tetratricopeptide repeat protein [Opitutaceae bacterium]|nr:tetratricopeptide repeat protein [Opitutaceae bacterium]